MLATCVAVDDRAHVRRRAAHVERERVLEARERGEPRRAHDAGGRAGEEGERRVRRRLLQRRETTRRAHHEGRRKPRARACAREGAEIAGENGPEVRIDSGRRRPLVLAELGSHLVRRDDVRARMAASQLLGDPALGLAVAEREEQRDGDRLRVENGQRGEVERHELASGTGSSTNADAALERHERGRMLDARPIQVCACLPAQVQDVLEALVRHQRRSRAAPLEECIRRDGGPVREALDVLGADGGGRFDHRRSPVVRLSEPSRSGSHRPRRAPRR